MGLVLPDDGFLAFLREQADAQRRAAGVRRGDLGLSRGARRRAGARGRDARPDHPGQGDRRRRARRGLRRPRRPDGPGGAGGRRLPGGHAVGQPAGHRGRPGNAGAARRRGLRAAGRPWRPPSPTACATRRPRPACPVHVCHTTGLLTVFFHDGPVASYADAKSCDTDALRGASAARHARPRRVPAAVAVRGLVRLARPHRRAGGAHPRRRRARRWPRSRDERARARWWRPMEPWLARPRRRPIPGLPASTPRWPTPTAGSCSRRSARAT